MSHKYIINKGYLFIKENLLNIQDIFLTSDMSIHKARNELKVISQNNIETIVKSFKVPHIINKIAYTFFRYSKAKKSYLNSQKLKKFTPTPIAYIEFYKNGLLHNSYFINENFKYDFTIREPLLDDSFPQKEKILRAFALFTLELHNDGIFHKDYSPGNILIKKENSNFIFKVVDINRMDFIELTEEKRAENFSKLWARDDELETIANEYAKHYPVSGTFSKKLCFYSNKNKSIKNFKKKLKKYFQSTK